MSGDGDKSPTKKSGISFSDQQSTSERKFRTKDGFKSAVPFVTFATLVAGVSFDFLAMESWTKSLLSILEIVLEYAKHNAAHIRIF